MAGSIFGPTSMTYITQLIPEEQRPRLSAVDSLEASFATLVIGMSESEYGVLVSIAGAGIVVGAIVNTVIVKKLTMTLMIGMGSIGVCCGYMIYAFSNSFLYAAVGFFTLACWLAFVNTGFTTFYQSNVPVNVMGRIGSLNDFISAILIIITTVFLGVAAEFLSIQIAVITGVVVMLLLGIMLSVCVLIPQSRCRASLNKV